MIDPRIERLRRLIAQLEQAPPSFRRDALVRAIRQRVATLEAGGQPNPWDSKSGAMQRLERLALD